MRKVTIDLNAKQDIVGNLIEHGIRYYRTLPSIQTPEGAVYSWEKTFATSDRHKVENDLASFGYTAEWTELNSLKYFYKMTSMKSHPVTNEKVRKECFFTRMIDNLFSKHHKANTNFTVILYVLFIMLSGLEQSNHHLSFYLFQMYARKIQVSLQRR